MFDFGVDKCYECDHFLVDHGQKVFRKLKFYGGTYDDVYAPCAKYSCMVASNKEVCGDFVWMEVGRPGDNEGEDPQT